MNYTNIYWKEKLLNYSTNIALGKKNISNEKIESIINYIDTEVNSTHYLMIIVLLYIFMKIIIKLDNDYVKLFLDIFLLKPQFTIIFSFVVSGYITKLIPFIPTYFFVNYIIFSIIILYKEND
tara:strand:+ start:423 stop:791 length:369 start_codon:yes stop_codon:yes gene_type:complete